MATPIAASNASCVLFCKPLKVAPQDGTYSLALSRCPDSIAVPLLHLGAQEVAQALILSFSYLGGRPRLL